MILSQVTKSWKTCHRQTFGIFTTTSNIQTTSCPDATHQPADILPRLPGCILRVPNCCYYIGAFQDSKQIYIVMEHCSGGDLLEQLLKEGRAMTEKRVVREVRGWGGRLCPTIRDGGGSISTSHPTTLQPTPQGVGLHSQHAA